MNEESIQKKEEVLMDFNGDSKHTIENQEIEEDEENYTEERKGWNFRNRNYHDMIVRQ